MTRWFWLLCILLFARLALGNETPDIPKTPKEMRTVTILESDYENLVEEAMRGRECIASLLACSHAFARLRVLNDRLQEQGLCYPPNNWKHGHVWIMKTKSED